jgi:hypothetical protein
LEAIGHIFNFVPSSSKVKGSYEEPEAQTTDMLLPLNMATWQTLVLQTLGFQHKPDTKAFNSHQSTPGIPKEAVHYKI